MITSVHNPRVQAVRRLQSQAKVRHKEGKFVVEGVRLVEEALQAGWEAEQVFFTAGLDERGRASVSEFERQGIPVEEVTDIVMKAASETETPQGLLAVIKNRVLPLPQELDFVLILDGVRDPGNLGTILRTAAAAGVNAVLLAPGNADATSPKVLRAGMGAQFHLPVRSMGWEAIGKLLRESLPPLQVFLADAAKGTGYTHADFCSPVALIIGGEAAGAGAEAASMSNDRVHIDLPGGSESLNAAVAASILLFEVVRQRGH